MFDSPLTASVKSCSSIICWGFPDVLLKCAVSSVACGLFMFSELSVARQHRQWQFKLHLTHVLTVLLTLNMYLQWEHALLYSVELNASKIRQKLTTSAVTVIYYFLQQQKTCWRKIGWNKWLSSAWPPAVTVTRQNSFGTDSFPQTMSFFLNALYFLTSSSTDECLWMSHSCYWFTSCLVFPHCAWNSTCLFKDISQLTENG